jgi:CDGSH-type Zn-finger protein
MPDSEVLCRNNGPLRITGNFVIQDAEGDLFDLRGRTVISLCRCGASENKPFCDGSHKGAGFDDEVTAG